MPEVPEAVNDVNGIVLVIDQTVEVLNLVIPIEDPEMQKLYLELILDRKKDGVCRMVHIEDDNGNTYWIDPLRVIWAVQGNVGILADHFRGIQTPKPIHTISIQTVSSSDSLSPKHPITEAFRQALLEELRRKGVID
jgi:hypothetical protein